MPLSKQSTQEARSEEQTMLSFKNLTGGYGSIDIVRNMSGEVPKGHCLCILGRNGVGKSTFMKILSGHLINTAGDLHLNKKSISTLPPERRRALGLSYAPQERPVFDNLTVHDNLILTMPSGQIDKYQKYLADFPILQKRISQTAGTLSGGERKILSFVRAMAEGGVITLLDEPTEGLQIENINLMKKFILQAKDRGQSFVVVEQHLQFAQAVADDILIMDQGQSVFHRQSSDVGRDDILKFIEV